MRPLRPFDARPHLLLAALLAWFAPAACQVPAAEALRPGHAVAFLAGGVGVLDSDPIGTTAGVQYRFPKTYLAMRPFVGFSFFEGGGRYGYAGIGPQLDLTRRLRIRSSLAIGTYRRGQIDLGGSLQFRSALEISYALNDEWRLGLVGDHLSHAGFERGINPGTEAVLLSLAWGF